MDVKEFDTRVAQWATAQVVLLNSCGRVEWAARAKEAYRAVAAAARVPLDLPRFETAKLKTEALHLMWLAEDSSPAKAASQLVAWAAITFLPYQMRHARDQAEYRAAMQRMSEAQYGPPVLPEAPVEVMHMRFPNVEDGCTLHLYMRADGAFSYNMSNGDCVGELQRNVAAYSGDEWAVSMFELMEAIYHMALVIPS